MGYYVLAKPHKGTVLLFVHGHGYLVLARKSHIFKNTSLNLIKYLLNFDSASQKKH